MKLAKAFGVSLFGLQGRLIEVEADISSNLPGFVLVGLPDASLQEATARVRAAITNTGLNWPNRKITVNLSPASVPKSGSSFDLAIAAAILAADSAILPERLSDRVLIGELTLDGAVRAVKGVLPAIQAAKALGVKKFVIPTGNRREAELVTGVEVIAIESLADFARFAGFEGELREPSLPVVQVAESPAKLDVQADSKLDIRDVLGQETAIRALTVAAVGGHHTLLVGPPGIGKTMLAERLPTLLPEIGLETRIELAAVQSLLGLAGQAAAQVPFVAPHHSISTAGLIGGGSPIPRPGLISQAHGGVLFLDEAPEFAPVSLDALREPLESGQISIARAGGVAVFPASCQLVIAANPCPCGFRGVYGRECTCSSAQRIRYQNRLSGPLLDRFDIRIRMQPATKTAKAKTQQNVQRPDSRTVQSAVRVARERTATRLAATPWRLNSQVSGSFLRRLNRANPTAVALLDSALTRGTLSMRGYDRCLRVAWSLADLEGEEQLTASLVGEALYLRGTDGWAAE